MKSLLFTANFGRLLFKKLTNNVKIKNINYSVNSIDNNKKIMKVLNVAEKNDAAKNISALLSRGNSQRREGFSKFNKIYEFDMRLWNQNVKMTMTSVSGHLLTYEFNGAYRKWTGCHPLALFDAPVTKSCPENFTKIKRTLEREIRQCDALIIWTDCDREGENIGFEIINVCQAVKRNIKVYRAKFSEITNASITRAIQTLDEPQKNVSDAVDVRSELDLRIGAAFTRFQTLRLQKVFPQKLSDMLISYGSCQFPTLGFVVERYLAIERFKPEPYWKIKVSDNYDNINVEFRWSRVRLFEKLPCQIYYDIVNEKKDAIVEKVTSKPKSKWRPLPLDTIELEKQGSKKLRMNAKETMKIAEKLYTQGLISYPRTETNIFPREFNLQTLVQQQTEHQTWGNYAQRVLQDGITPRAGKKSDQAHPPIHPTKFTNNLQGNEAKVYEFVVRHFLACVSKNAEGYETTVDIDIAGEKFTTNGLQIIAKNYLDVYIYEKWNAKEIHIYEEGKSFKPTSIEMVEEQTSAPNLLTEADLISLMDKHGIGTDATHAEHIETIKSRQYVGLKNNIYFMPGKLGIGLVMGYDNMGFQMSKPNLRAELENDLKLICQGQKNPADVLTTQINNYREVFRVALERANLIDEALAEYLDERPTGDGHIEMITPTEEVPIFKCPKCGQNMVLRERKDSGKKYIACMGFPDCKNSIWFQDTINDIEILQETCDKCTGNPKKLKFKIRPGAIPMYGNCHETCIGGCDDMFNQIMSIKNESVKKTNGTQDSGYSSASHNTTVVSQSQHQTTTTTANRAVRGGGAATARGGGASTTNRNNTRTQNFPSSRPTNNHNNKRTSDDWGPSDTSMFNESKRPKISNQSTWSSSSSLVNSNNNNNSNNSNTNQDNILCNCHEPAIKLTVRKEGPNTGRQFFKCSKTSSGCDFFLWDDAEPSDNNRNSQRNNTSLNRTTTRVNNNSINDDWDVPSGNSWNQNNNNNTNNYNNNNRTNTNNGGGGGGDDAPSCVCGEPARKLTVKKDGPNKGRSFWGCPQGVSTNCKFFVWADDNDAGGSGTSGGGGGGGFNNFAVPKARGRGGARGGGATGGTRAKRKCGNCGNEGHTKKTCPENSMD